MGAVTDIGMPCVARRGSGRACNVQRRGRRSRAAGGWRGRDLRGFTLLELMITLVVLAIGVLALGQLMPAGSRALNRSRSMTSGTAFAAQKLEDLKALAWTDAGLTAGSHSDATGKYTRSWTVTDNTPLAGTKKVEVTVSWASSSGTRSTTIHTYLTQLAN